MRLHSYKKLYLSTFTLVLLVTGSLFHTSCERENTDPPVITNVRDIDPEMADVPIDGSGLESWVVIQGNNLASTQQIYFNEYEAVFNPAYVTETNIVVQIPGGTPNIGTDPDAPNTVRVVTKYGEAVYDFIIYAPPAEVSYISNEFASPGDTIVLGGRYFFLVDSIIFSGDIPADQFEATSDGEWCIVVVPEGAEAGPLRVVTAGGVGGSVYGAHYYDRAGMICDFDALNTWEGWGGTVVNTASHPVLPELTGNAFLAEGNSVVTGTWWVQEMAMPINSGLYPNYDTIASAENVLVKFELFAKGSWNSGEYDVRLVKRDGDGEWVDYYSYFLKPWLLEDGTIIDYESDTWTTIIIQLSEFTLNSSGEYPKSFSDISGYNFFGCYFQNTGLIPGEQELPLIQLGIDNIRMVGWQP
ncbi:hypothetical protein ES705_10736 [subsurface metagenome]